MDPVNDNTEILESVSADTRKSGSVPPILEAVENPSGELEQRQRMRSGERLPAPAVADVSVHAETGTLDSVHDETEIVESVSAATETVDSVPAAIEQPEALPGDEE
jgi:hypothetical protein